MYEGLRYFAGKGARDGCILYQWQLDGQVGLTAAHLGQPIQTTTSAAKAPWCASPTCLVVCDINPSFDSNQLPGSYFGSFTGDLTDFECKALADTITAVKADTPVSASSGNLAREPTMVHPLRKM